MTFEIDFLIVGLMQVLAFFVLGTTGFGATVISAPVTNGLFGTTMGVPYGTLVCIPFLYYLAIKDRKNISWKDLSKIVILCAPGIFIGQKLFYSISPATAKLAIGAMITIIAVMNIHKYIIKPLVLKEVEVTDTPDTLGKKVYRYGCLILGGIVHGAFTIGGPLITVYTLEAVKDKKKFRNTMTSLWCILNVWNAFTQYQMGAFTPRLGSALLVAMPLAAIGYFAGIKFLDKINREQFLRIVYMLLLFIGVNMLFRNIPWTPEIFKGVVIGLPIIVIGYILIIMKNRKNIMSN